MEVPKHVTEGLRLLGSANVSDAAFKKLVAVSIQSAIQNDEDGSGKQPEQVMTSKFRTTAVVVVVCCLCLADAALAIGIKRTVDST